ncbi:MAG: Dam family site-specific DNA-(adenine-N6)-methyltransferase [Candidatus Hydrogenedentes bacterium]|nr:Dam family site-specific DNA-(adenine-N6)-methyltransferase [Candidatus Hydrogenedentota bacterium]
MSSARQGWSILADLNPSESRSRLLESRPFIKWAGGKTQLLPLLRDRIPEGRGTYHEPFLGGGALFFAIVAGASPLIPERVVLNDLNQRLITTFKVVKDSPKSLLDKLGTMAAKYLHADEKARANYYYEVRGLTPRTSLGVAAKFIFLNKTCYNGLYRENRKGIFNVPHGRYASPNIDDTDAIEANEPADLATFQRAIAE